MMDRKISELEVWKPALMLLGVGAITLVIIGSPRDKSQSKPYTNPPAYSSKEQERVEKTREDASSRIVFYDVLHSYDSSVQIRELGGNIRRYRDQMALRNYMEGSRREDVLVEEHDTNRDGRWDFAIYLSESTGGRWPVIGLNPRSSEYQALLKKFGEGITQSTRAVARFSEK